MGLLWIALRHGPQRLLCCRNGFVCSAFIQNVHSGMKHPSTERKNVQQAKYTHFQNLFSNFHYHPSPSVYLFERCNVKIFSTLRQDFIKKHKVFCVPVGAGLRYVSQGNQSSENKRKKSVLIYVCAVGVFMLGMSYAGVPLYRMFCQATGLGGQAVRGHDVDKVETMTKVEDRIIRVRFNADVASSMRWNFRPQQTEVRVLPGETALAFYTAKNPTNVPIIGISTYNVVPFEAGQYFNKIQCFCFEEQRLNPHEQVDMPVFFYIDPEFAEDPKLQGIDTITLSYTFFEAKEGLQLPLPSYATT